MSKRGSKLFLLATSYNTANNIASEKGLRPYEWYYLYDIRSLAGCLYITVWLCGDYTSRLDLPEIFAHIRQCKSISFEII